ncbi:threonine synthase [compost metagenome]
MPTARGDLLWGIFLGWQHLLQSGRIQRLPRLHAIEPYARLSQAQATGDARGLWDAPTDQYSIAGGTCTLQSLEALSSSGGTPVEVSDSAAAQAQQRLERRGISTELSSAAALAAVARLRRSGVLDAESSVVLMLTSDGRRG